MKRQTDSRGRDGGGPCSHRLPALTGVDNSQTSQARLRWMDGLKGFAILVVILGHVLSGYLDAGIYQDAHHSFYVLRTWIYSFHMPLFFLISGFTYTLAYCPEGTLNRRRMLRQLLSLIWLYLFYSVLQWCIKMLVPSLVNESYTIEDLKNLLWIPLGNFWYLYVLILYYVLATLLRLHRWNPHWLLALGGVSILVLYYHLGWYKLTLYRVCYHFFFFALGSVLCRCRWPFRSVKLAGISSMFLATACWFNWLIGVWHWAANWRFGIALAVSMLFLILFFRLKQLSGLRLFQLCGKYCMELYLLHTFFTAGLRSLLYSTGLAPWLSVGLNFVLSTAICLVLAIAARRVWWGSLFFRPAGFVDRIRAGCNHRTHVKERKS